MESRRDTRAVLVLLGSLSICMAGGCAAVPARARSSAPDGEESVLSRTQGPVAIAKKPAASPSPTAPTLVARSSNRGPDYEPRPLPAPAEPEPARRLDFRTERDPFFAGLQGATISRVVIERGDVFDETQDPRWLLERFNELHVTTRRRVIERELLLHVGDPYDPDLAEETERNLRRLGFLTDARVMPVALDDGTVALHVLTRDRFTLRLGGSVGVFSGASKSRAAVGETNLFGLGKELTGRYEEEEGKVRTTLGFKDPQFLGRHEVLRVSASDRNDGDDVALSLERPFWSLEENWSFGVDVSKTDRDISFFQLGDTLAEVPDETSLAGAFLTRAFGPRDQRLKVGAEVRYQADKFGTAEGDDPDFVRVPGNTHSVSIGPTFALDLVPTYAKGQYLDSLGLVEDVPLGARFSAFAGLHRRDEAGAGGPQNELLLRMGVQTAQQFGAHLVTTQISGMERLHGSDMRGWSASSSVHYYYQGLPHQTLAASLTFDALGEREDLEPQLLLGDENGLRGYESRFFSGDRRVRLNLENRIHPDWDLSVVTLGFVVFADAGLVFDHGDTVTREDVYRSVGVGLRVGSPQLIRRDVVRIDLALPLDDHPQKDFGISLSASVGQIFDLFGNAEGLDRQF